MKITHHSKLHFFVIIVFLFHKEIFKFDKVSIDVSLIQIIY